MPSLLWSPGRGCRIGPQNAVQVEHRRAAAELREQRADLRAVMRLMIEEVRQEHLERVLGREAGVVDIVHAAALEACRQRREEQLDAPVHPTARLAQGLEFVDLNKIDVVGVFPDYQSAEEAWRAAAQRTVDDAEMRYVIVHLHRLLEPELPKA